MHEQLQKTKQYVYNVVCEGATMQKQLMFRIYRNLRAALRAALILSGSWVKVRRCTRLCFSSNVGLSAGTQRCEKRISLNVFCRRGAALQKTNYYVHNVNCEGATMQKQLLFHALLFVGRQRCEPEHFFKGLCGVGKKTFMFLCF